MSNCESGDDEQDTPPTGAAAVGVGGGDLECSIYQNYSASEVFVQGLAGVVNQQGRDRELSEEFTPRGCIQWCIYMNLVQSRMELAQPFRLV